MSTEPVPGDAELPPAIQLTPKELAARDMSEFRDSLKVLTPRVFVTYAIIIINVAVFGLMLAGGVDWMSPTVDDLIRFGGDYAPRTTGGEPWRLITNTFIHVGIIHIALNMLVLAQIGPVVERLVGNLSFLVVYIIAGVMGSLASIAWNAGQVSAGASGAIFGVYGLFLAVLLRGGAKIPDGVRNTLLKGAGFFIIFNLVYSATSPNIDQLAHLGGLASGFLFGLIVALPLDAAGRQRRLRRALVALGVGAVVIGGLTAAMPRSVDFIAELHGIDSDESAVVTRVKQLTGDKVSGQALAAAIRTEFLPPLKSRRDRLAALTRIRGHQREILDIVIAYEDKRAEGLTLLADGNASGDEGKIKQSDVVFGQAMAIAKRLTEKKN